MGRTRLYNRGMRHALSALLLALLASTAFAWPTKPVTLIVPYPPGGGTDVIARIVQEPLQKQLGQPVLIENRGGAGGSIGTAVAAKATDRHTLLFTLSSHTINPLLYKLSFDIDEELAGVYDRLGFEMERVNAGHARTLPLPATFVIAPDDTIA